ncbi:MAG: PIN domain-containing protein [Candidatus Diapherotrites archaeon]
MDANIIFSALIKARDTRSILLFSGSEFYVPEKTIHEFRKHLPTLNKKTGLKEKEISGLLETLIDVSEIRIIPFEEFSYRMEEAAGISPDPDDAAYIALALHLNCALWSNDRALKKQGKVKVITTGELLGKPH